MGLKMQSRWLASVAAAVALLLIASSSALAAAEEKPQSAAEACGSITEGASDGAPAACEQGYKDATNKGALGASCALGVGAIEAAEYQHDCKFGFIFAGGVSASEPTPSSKAESECASITEGASDGSPAACEQGYEDALAGDTQEVACDHLGAGAITAVEYGVACEDGWFVAKGEATCMPGSDPMNGQQGTTIKSDAATDKTCSEA
jgi:hypothetical protein